MEQVEVKATCTSGAAPQVHEAINDNNETCSKEMETRSAEQPQQVSTGHNEEAVEAVETQVQQDAVTASSKAVPEEKMLAFEQPSATAVSVASVTANTTSTPPPQVAALSAITTNTCHNNAESATESTPEHRSATGSRASSTPHTPRSQQDEVISNTLAHLECLARLEKQRQGYEQQLEQLQAAMTQKDNMIALYQRENAILDKEKLAFRKEKELANKEKEATVIKFAMKEKLLLDAKKEKEIVEKQLADAKKEIKNVSLRFQAVNEEKSRMTYIMDEKCNEVRKYQRECEKLKTDYGHLESKLKYHANKLNIEIETRMNLEKKLEEERNAPNKLEEKANENLKMEYEANTILLKHEIKSKTEMAEHLTRELHKSTEQVKQLQEQLGREILARTDIAAALQQLQEEHNAVQNAYSEEMLVSAKLRGQLDELQVLKTQNTLNEEKLTTLNATAQEMQEKLLDNAQDLEQLRAKERELLSINKEISESIVGLQNLICLLKAKAQGIEAENVLLKKEKRDYDNKYEALQRELSGEQARKLEERQLFAKHLSEKTKLYELTKEKLENVVGDFEATKHKHATVVKELQRELLKYKKSLDQSTNGASGSRSYCSHCQNGFKASGERMEDHTAILDGPIAEGAAASALSRTHSRTSSQSSQRSGSRHASETSESETVVSNATAIQADLQGPSKKHLVERILRLQQASARQTEKIDFLENHTLSLVAELQKKSKVVQYYMLRDQAGALTSTKSDQNKSELAKYGNGVMSAIYNGIKGDTKSMTLELSLEINKKLQAVLEDTLLKNITLKENLDVLGLEVDNLTRKLRQLEVRE